MTKNLKYTLLLALFCSMQIPAQAGWRYNLFVNIALSLYPLNMIAGGFFDLKNIAQDAQTPVDNAAVKKAYPHAFSYIERQLKNLNIDPTNLQIKDCPHASSKCRIKSISVPLSELEYHSQQKSTKSQCKTNLLEGITAHEMGHLKRKSVIKSVAARVLIVAGTEICAHYTPFMRTKILGTLFKTISSNALFTTYCHFDEYCADGYSIEHFKNNRQALSDLAIFFLNAHQSNAQISVEEQRTNKEKIMAIHGNFDPLAQNCYQWFVGSHGSDIARANRLIKAAGIPCNQRLLAKMLKNQFCDEIFEKNVRVDTAPIIHALKQPREKIIADYGIDPGPSPEEQAKALDAVELPYPLQTYGQ